MPKKLKNLSVHEVSFVDRGANPGAEILLYKRNSATIENTDLDPKYSSTDKGAESMSLEELQKQMKEMADLVAKQGEDLAAVQKENGELKAEVEKAGKNPFAAFGDEKKPKKDEEEMDAATKKALESEALAKAEQEAIQKEITDLKKELSTERDARISLEFAKKAESEFPNLAGDPVKKGELLKAISGFADEDLKKFAMESLKAANGAVGESFTEKGRAAANAGEATDPYAKMEKMAEEYAAEHKVTKAVAHAELALTEGYQKLYTELEKKK